MLNLYYLKEKEELLDGRYQLIEKIGGGGFSEVWLACDLRSQVNVVLKVYASSQGLDEEGVKMFRKEFSLVCNLNHTNILKPFTFDIFQGSPYIVLPYCEKGSASKLIGKISEEELWNFIGQVASGLAHLHKHGIIHQDIKPANILINSDNQYMITDFGISTGLRNTIRKSRGTDDDSGSGTTAYMPYECLGAKPSNVISRDIWAFGATLYELTTGDVPFGELGGMNQHVLGGKVPKIEKEFSADLKELIYKCLELNTWDRPSAEEIVGMVQAHEAGNRILVAHSKKRMALFISSAAVILIGLLLFSLNGNGEEAGVNPNDSTFLAKIEDANEVVRVEKAKGNKDSIDVSRLCVAAKAYKEALSLPVTDTVIETRGRMLWKESQNLIDETYLYLCEKGLKYAEADAEMAARILKERSETLKEYVSDSVKRNDDGMPRVVDVMRE